ncbi:MAG TPA: M20 family peptidase [Anaerolineae bacterium]|nr:M20 family peptidase [Anaerolineae bacterium]
MQGTIRFMNNPTDILNYLTACRQEMIDFVAALARVESPTSRPETQTPVQDLLREPLEQLGFDVEIIPGEQSGGMLWARPSILSSAQPQQLLLGHSDTVWPVGTLAEMPVAVEGNVMRGPGVLDMKSGLTQMIFALQALYELGWETAVAPIILINSDEEVGSYDSRPHIERLAQAVERVYVLEPALGSAGKIKTARKGVGEFIITVRGKAAHAGLEPENGISATLELAHLTLKLHQLNRPEEGVTVNVGVVEGGARSNVVAAECRALVDVRAPTIEAAEALETAVNNLQPTLPGASLTIEGGFNRLPMERTPRNQALWHLAQALGQEIGLKLDEGTAGGGSDGNLTSPFTATLDGLGPVGGGAHATHEHILLDSFVERTALLALLLQAPSIKP